MSFVAKELLLSSFLSKTISLSLPPQAQGAVLSPLVLLITTPPLQLVQAAVPVRAMATPTHHPPVAP